VHHSFQEPTYEDICTYEERIRDRIYIDKVPEETADEICRVMRAKHKTKIVQGDKQATLMAEREFVLRHLHAKTLLIDEQLSYSFSGGENSQYAFYYYHMASTLTNRTSSNVNMTTICPDIDLLKSLLDDLLCTSRQATKGTYVNNSWIDTKFPSTGRALYHTPDTTMNGCDHAFKAGILRGRGNYVNISAERGRSH